MKREYQDIADPSMDGMTAAMARNDPEELLTAVIGLALYHEDSTFAEDVCIQLSKHEHFNVRGNAILGFGHLARRFGSLREETVKPIIESALNDPSEYIRGQAWAAADDVSHFLKWKVKGFEG